jgi:hypothetical protein
VFSCCVARDHGRFAFLFGSRVARPHDRLDISANMKITLDLHPLRIASLYKIFENYVYDVLVKDLYVAKRIYVELQALQFNASLVRDIL